MSKIIDETKVQSILLKYGLHSEYPISLKDLAEEISSCVIHYTITNTINCNTENEHN